MPFSQLLTSIRKRLGTARAFAAAERGNVAIIVAFCLIPIVGLVGLGTDYGVAITDKSKLDNAADAAALAAVVTAKAYVAANQLDLTLITDAIAAGQAQAPNAFVVNAGNVPFATIPTPVIGCGAAPASGTFTVCLTYSALTQTFSSTVAYSTGVQNHFGQIFQVPTMTVAGTAAATTQLPSYLDFYLLVDVSGSMGLPTNATDQATLLNAYGCQFACHFPGQTASYTYANNNNIPLRAGSVNSAVCGLLLLASTPPVTHQYRVGLYPFITQMATLAALNYADPAPTTASSSSNALWNAAGCVPSNSSPNYTTSNPPVFTALLDTGTTQLYTGNNPSTGIGSGGTHFETIFSTMQSTISSFGNGSSSLTSRPFVFLITDGMQNSQYYDTVKSGVVDYPGSPSTFSGYSAANFTGSSPAAMNSNQCTALKNLNVTISVLYIPYGNLTLSGSNQGETQAADNAIPNIPTALYNCATTGYFYTANTPTDINNALINMFNQAVQASHLNQ